EHHEDRESDERRDGESRDGPTEATDRLPSRSTMRLARKDGVTRRVDHACARRSETRRRIAPSTPFRTVHEADRLGVVLAESVSRDVVRFELAELLQDGWRLDTLDHGILVVSRSEDLLRFLADEELEELDRVRLVRGGDRKS